MKELSRRDSLKVLSAGVATLSMTALTGSDARAQDTAPAPALAFRGQHKPRALSFDPSKLKGLSEKLIRSHWENNYGGAVRALNTSNSGRCHAEGKGSAAIRLRSAKREELLRRVARAARALLRQPGGDGKASGPCSSHQQNVRWLRARAGEFSKTAISLQVPWVGMLTYNLHTQSCTTIGLMTHANVPTGLRYCARYV